MLVILMIAMALKITLTVAFPKIKITSSLNFHDPGHRKSTTALNKCKRCHLRWNGETWR